MKKLILLISFCCLCLPVFGQYSGKGSSGGGAAIGSPVTGGTSGSVPYFDASGNLAQDNANFFYNSTGTKYLRVPRLDIGTKTNVLFDALDGRLVVNLNNAFSSIFFQFANQASFYDNNGSTVFTVGNNGVLNQQMTGAGNNGLTLNMSASPGIPFRILQSDGTTPVFQVNATGAVRGSQATVTASSTLSASTTIVNSASATTQTLPTAVGNQGLRLIVKNTGAGTTTVTTTSGQTIFVASAVTTQNLLTGDSFTYESTGANWIAY